MLIRKISPLDESAILEIVSPQISTAFHWPAEQMRSELVHTQGLVLEHQGILVAFICLRDAIDAWEISVVSTRREFQRQGWMEKLLTAIIEQYGSQRQLWLEVHENNVSACKLYEKMGFRRQGTRGGYYQDGSAAILYTRFP